MIRLVVVFVAVFFSLSHNVSASCVNNNTDSTLVVGQYSLISEQDVYKIEPGQRVCRDHQGLFHHYNVGVVPYGNMENIYRFFLKTNNDELFVEGHCDSLDGSKCRGKFTFGRGRGHIVQQALASGQLN